jgi:formylglycine-generating enzyme required for sulfatase activity
MEFVKIPRGSFMMGCSPGDAECYAEEKPAHRVVITRAFELGKYLVTQAQYPIEKRLRAGGSETLASPSAASITYKGIGNEWVGTQNPPSFGPLGFGCPPDPNPDQNRESKGRRRPLTMTCSRR